MGSRALASASGDKPAGVLLTLPAGVAELFVCSGILWLFLFWGRSVVPAAVVKLVPVAVLIVHVARRAGAGGMRRWMLVGLSLSLLGDLLLTKAVDQFIPGLVSFLMAHLAYIRALQLDGAPWRAGRGVPVVVFGLGMGGLLLPSMEPLMAVAVGAYIVVISVMVWRALARVGHPGVPGTGWMAIGAMLFLSSDTMLAWSRFRADFWGDDLLVIVTYWAAQLFLAAGAVTHRSRP